ncbi:MAG: exonuclease SbcCD subunit D [Desulfurococcales archaeon]|nr:exonuclease SbcCD subunit D [Desulfurococcales archaeon]
MSPPLIYSLTHTSKGLRSLLIAHMADIHLGLRQYGLLWREEDFYARFKEAVEKAVREGVEAILISGDMFDRARPPISALRAAKEALNIPQSKGIPIYAVLGEHDIPKVKDLPPHFVLDEYVKVLGTAATPLVQRLSVEGKEYCIAGISHRPLTSKGRQRLRELMDEAARKVCRDSVLMMHQSIANVFKLEPGIDLNEIPKAFKYVAMGHLHKRWVSETYPKVAYPGSLEIVNMGEIEEWRRNGKGFYLVDISGDEASIQKVDVDVTPQEVVTTQYPNHRRDSSQAIERLASLNRKSILHVKVCMPPSVRADPASEIYALARMRGIEGTVYLRVTTTPCGLQGRGEEGPEVTLESEEEVIKSLLKGGGPEAEAVAKAIIALKNAAVDAATPRELDPFIEELTKHSTFWSNLVRLPPLPEVEEALKPLPQASEVERLSEGGEERPKQRGRGLEAFLRRRS